MTEGVDIAGLAEEITLYEAGELNDADTYRLFRALVDTGAIYHLQGSYQRTAADFGLLELPGWYYSGGRS